MGTSTAPCTTMLRSAKLHSAPPTFIESKRFGSTEISGYGALNIRDRSTSTVQCRPRIRARMNRLLSTVRQRLWRVPRRTRSAKTTTESLEGPEPPNGFLFNEKVSKVGYSN